jgi:short-subunit dehydrogenase
MDLQNARVVITGASRGIGAAMADELATAGASLTLIARNEQNLAAVAERTGAAMVLCDVTDADARNAAVTEIEATGPIDVWINNAGLGTVGPFVEQEPADIAAVLAVNLEAPMLLMRSVLPAMLERGQGTIVNVSSMAMAVNTPWFAPYGASKSGLSAFVESLRIELADTGVELMTVEIGETETDMLRELRAGNASVDAMYERFEKLQLQRLIEPEEVARGVRSGLEKNKKFVRLPKRAAVFPAIVNLPRNISNALQRGI